MKTTRWFLIVATCFGLPAGVMEGLFYFFPLEEGGLPSVAIKILVYLVGLQLTVTLAAILEWRSERHALIREVRASILGAMDAHIEKSMQRGVIGHFLGSKGGSAISSIFASVADSLLKRLQDKPADLLDACSPFIESEVALALRHVDDSLGGGAKATIADHLKVTRYLCSHSASYLQIQRRAYAVPDEWTADWMKFVDDLKSSNISRSYIVLLPADELQRDAQKIESMRKYLVSRGFKFGVCNFHAMVDSTGGSMPAGVFELFGNGIIKLVELPEGKYHGGTQLTMVITDGTRRPDVLHIAGLVEQLADYGDKSA